MFQIVGHVPIISEKLLKIETIKYKNSEKSLFYCEKGNFSISFLYFCIII